MRFSITCLLLFLAFRGYAQNFRIQVAAFSDSVDMSYFLDRGVEGIRTERSSGGIYQYMLGNYETREEAEDIQEQLQSRGFTRPVIIDLEVQRVLDESNCAYANGKVKPVDDEDEPNPVRTIFFEDGQFNLDQEDLVKLDKIFAEMKIYPDKSLRIMGFTDNKGAAEANLELSAQRAKATRNYLINKGIKAIRLFVETYGEADPLYDNKDIYGKEIPENQRWNNRVMMKYKE